MSQRNAHLTSAANGFYAIETRSWLLRCRLGLLLTFRYGFRRSGRWLTALPDESIHADFVNREKRILAGWDNWSGYYLLAENEETSQFLQVFFERHCG